MREINNLLVMKFGGTSVGSAERMKVACDLIAAEAARRPVVAVVSAMSKITDLLLDTTRQAEAGDQAGLDFNLHQLELRHLTAADALIPAGSKDGPSHTHRQIFEIVSEFRRIVNGIQMLGHRPPRTVDEAIAAGERLSALLVSEHLKARGIPAEAVNAAEAIVTDAVFNNASPLMEATEKKANERLMPLLRRKEIPIVTGFNGATADGRPTTLGRGGSDFSASILAASLDAQELWIWTDVDGIMTADPRLVTDAAVLDQVTYAEAAELAYNGAKVLHPRTLAPLVEKQIPVWSKNSFAADKPGTKIVGHFDEPRGARAVTSMSDVALISMEPVNAVLSGTRLMARSLDALALANVEILVFTSSSYRQSFCLLVRKSDVERALEALESNLSIELAHGYLRPIEVDHNVGLIAVVGEGMRGTPGLAGRVFTAISREQINIIAIAQGSSEITIAIVVNRAGLEQAVRAVHEECGLGT